MTIGAAQSNDTESRIQFLERLKSITHQIHSAENLDDILLRLKESIVSLFDAERITIYAVDKATREIYSKYKVGDIPYEIRVPINKLSVAGFVAATGGQISINDAYNEIELLAIYPDLKFDRSWDEKTGFRTRQILAQPLMYEKYLLGVIQIINKKSGGPFTSQDRTALQEIADILGLAFYNYQKRTVRYQSKYDYLIHQDLISRDDIQKAITEARTRKADVADVLMKVYKIKKESLARSISAYYNVKFVAFEPSYNPPLNLLDRLTMKNPFKFMAANLWVPYKLSGDKMVIVIDDPGDHARIGDIQKIVKGEFELWVGLQDDIIRIIGKLSGDQAGQIDTGDGIDAVLADIEGDEEATEAEFDDAGMSVSEADSGIVKLANQIILDAYSRGASDIHVETYPGKQNTIIRYRIDGICSEYKQIPANWKKALLARIKIMSNLNIAERRLPQDGKIQLKVGAKTIELRVATLPTLGGNEDAVLRILAASEPIPLDKLNLSKRNIDIFKDLVERPNGIILVVGPTGSGKTTTLHSALGWINKPDRKIWTAEDPVEITQNGLRQVQMHAQINLTFATALRAFLRADPDVIMIGEMRDQETASMGVEASLTGHMVFSTLHTNSAPETVTRLIDLGLDPFNFADALLMVLAQRLVRTLCSDCKESYQATEKELAELAREYGEKHWAELGVDTKTAKLCRPKGCDKCNDSGYRGRTGLHEVLTVTLEQKSLIQHNASVEELRTQAIKDGMRTLRQDGIWKVTKGDTTFEQVRRVCSV